MVVTVGEVIELSQNADILGITDRNIIIRYIKRAYQLASAKSNWNPQLGYIDVCADCHGWITLPSFIEAPLAVNVNGMPAYFRNSWFEFHINGPGDRCIGGMCSPMWDDRGSVATFQEIKHWGVLAALTENPADGAGNLFLTVVAITVDSNFNEKEVTLKVPLLTGYASTDPTLTQIKRVVSVTKPVTQGYVKLLCVQPQQLSNAATIGYYEPGETTPRYRRFKVNQSCGCVRVRYRRHLPPLQNDYDVIPISSSEAMIRLLKAIRFSDAGDIATSQAYMDSAVELLNEYQAAEDGPGVFQIQIDPSFGMGGGPGPWY